MALPIANHSALPFDSSGTGGKAGGGDVVIPEYVRRAFNFKQMDLEYTFSQMVQLCFEPSKVYNNSSWRKQTKNQWARDDPGFVVVLTAFVVVAAIAFGVAFGVSSTVGYIALILHGMGHLFGTGICIATAGWHFGNKHLRVTQSHSVEQKIEWMYAWDIHCNAFFPSFLIASVAHFYLLPILVGRSFFAAFLGNVLIGLALTVYWYISFLGYTSMPFLKNTEVFLYPVVFVGILFFFFLMFRINVSRVLLSMYF